MVSLKPSEIDQSIPSTSSADQNKSTGRTEPNGGKKPLDIVFLQDTTGSQGPYIKAARSAIRDICDKISTTAGLSKELIRFGLIAFRDHPPQERTYVTKNFGFTSDIGVMQQNLTGLVASGGGDGPEAQTAALADALNMEWATDGIKMVILITDSPPHGLGEDRDGFSVSPDQNDPLEIVRQMAERGITIFVIACEPSLSQYKYALDFYTALTQITSGRVFPLLQADKLGDYIVGTALETIETEKLIEEFEQVIVSDVYTNAVPMEKVAENLQQYMNSKGVKINTIDVEDIYIQDNVAAENLRVWISSNKLSDARNRVQPILQPRIQAQFLSSSSYYSPPSYSPRLPHIYSKGVARTTHTDDAPPRSAVAPYQIRKRPGQPMAQQDQSMAQQERLRNLMRERQLQAAAAYPQQQQQQQQQRYVPSIQPQMQQVSIASQQVSQMQAQRVVMQSIARNSKVTASGMFSKQGGQAATSTSESTPES